MSFSTEMAARPGRSTLLNLPLPELMERLAASSDGLSTEEAEKRIEQYGRNELDHRRVRPPVVSFLMLLAGPLNLVLIAAGVVSAFFGETSGAIIIGVMVLTSAVLEFVQEYTSEQAAQRLARQVAVTATVLRDGAPTEIRMAEVVPGDVVYLSVGDIIPADARVLAAKDFFVHQAALTGESQPVEKVLFSGARPHNTPLSDMDHVVHVG